VEGISLTSIIVETLCYTVIVGYSVNHQYVFSSYGDVFACWIQNMLLCILLLWYRRLPVMVWLPGVLLFSAFNWWIVGGMCGEQLLLMFQVRLQSINATWLHNEQIQSRNACLSFSKPLVSAAWSSSVL
jgi:hypothetical protein